MTHRVVNLYNSNGLTSTSSNNAAVSVNYSNAAADLTGLTWTNGYLYFDLKNSDWDDVSQVKFYFSPVNTFDANSGYYISTIDSMQNYDVSSSHWSTFRIPVNSLSLTGPSFDLADSIYFRLKLTFTTSEDHYLNTKNWYLEYGDEVRETMQFSLVASGGNDAINLEPEWSYKEDMEKIEKEHRLENGDLFIYKTGDYDKASLKLKYVPRSDALMVNSWWHNNLQCNYFTANSYDATFRQMIIRGKKQPFQSYQQPYVDLMEGQIDLEGVD